MLFLLNSFAKSAAYKYGMCPNFYGSLEYTIASNAMLYTFSACFLWMQFSRAGKKKCWIPFWILFNIIAKCFRERNKRTYIQTNKRKRKGLKFHDLLKVSTFLHRVHINVSDYTRENMLITVIIISPTYTMYAGMWQRGKLAAKCYRLRDNT